MRSRASYREASATKSLAQRLAEVEHGGVLPAAPKAGRFVPALTTRRYRDLAACFSLGIASSCIAGGIATFILLFVNAGDAHGNARLLSQAHARPLPTRSGLTAAPYHDHGLTVVPKQLVDRVELVSIASLLSRDLVPEGRQLWWKLPTVTADAN